MIKGSLIDDVIKTNYITSWISGHGIVADDDDEAVVQAPVEWEKGGDDANKSY